jgi:hypothetical protein
MNKRERERERVGVRVREEGERGERGPGVQVREGREERGRMQGEAEAGQPDIKGKVVIF